MSQWTHTCCFNLKRSVTFLDDVVWGNLEFKQTSKSAELQTFFGEFPQCGHCKIAFANTACRVCQTFEVVKLYDSAVSLWRLISDSSSRSDSPNCSVSLRGALGPGRKKQEEGCGVEPTLFVVSRIFKIWLGKKKKSDIKGIWQVYIFFKNLAYSCTCRSYLKFLAVIITVIIITPMGREVMRLWGSGAVLSHVYCFVPQPCEITGGLV